MLGCGSGDRATAAQRQALATAAAADVQNVESLLAARYEQSIDRPFPRRISPRKTGWLTRPAPREITWFDQRLLDLPVFGAGMLVHVGRDGDIEWLSGHVARIAAPEFAMKSLMS